MWCTQKNTSADCLLVSFVKAKHVLCLSIVYRWIRNYEKSVCFRCNIQLFCSVVIETILYKLPLITLLYL